MTTCWYSVYSFIYFTIITRVLFSVLWWSLFGMIYQKAVVVLSIVAKKYFARVAVPCCFMPLLCFPTQVTSATDVRTLRIMCCRKLNVCWVVRLATSPLMAHVCPYQFLGQRNPELLQRRESHVSIMLIQNEGIGDGYIYKKPPNVFVAFPSLEPYPIVLPKLVISIDSSHILVVVCYCLGTANSHLCAVFQFPFHCFHFCRTSVAGDNNNRPTVLPEMNTEVPRLLADKITTIWKSFVEVLLELLWEVFPVRPECTTSVSIQCVALLAMPGLRRNCRSTRDGTHKIQIKSLIFLFIMMLCLLRT